MPPSSTISENTSTDKDRSAAIDRLREVAASVGSQPKAAQAAQVSVRSMRLYLAGKVPPSVKAISNLAHASGYSLDWLLTGKGEKKRTPGKVANPQSQPYDAALDEEEATVKMLRHIKKLVGVYRDAGIPLVNEDDEDDVLGAAVDVVKAWSLSVDLWESTAGAVVEAQRLAIKEAKGRLQQHAASTKGPRGS